METRMAHEKRRGMQRQQQQKQNGGNATKSKNGGKTIWGEGRLYKALRPCPNTMLNTRNAKVAM